MVRHVTHTLLGLLLVAPLACKSDSDKNTGAISGVSNERAEQMNAERSKFETSEDPPVNAETHFAAGQFAETQGAMDKAVQQYEQTLKLDPKHQRALYRLGIVYAQMRNFPGAIEAWKRYVVATDRSAAAYSNLGFCYELASDPAAAEEAYRTGIARDPRSMPCRVNYGLMLARAGRTADAVAQLGVVLKPAEVRYNIASVYEQKGMIEEAKAEYQQALRIDPNMLDAKTRLAKLNKGASEPTTNPSAQQSAGTDEK
jgi:tetratricopeptide (TPR) repeat protein